MSRPRRVRFLLALLLCVALLGLAAPPAPAQAGASPDLESQLQQQQSALTALQGQLAAAQDRLAQARDRAARLGQLESTARGRVQDQERYINALLTQLAAAQTQLQQTTTALGADEARLSHEQHLLDLRIQALYEEGPVGLLAVVLSANSFADFITRFNLLKDVLAADAALFRQIRADRDVVALHRMAAVRETARVEALRVQADAQFGVLQSQQQAVAVSRQQADAEAAAAADEAAAIQASSQRIQEMITSLRHQIFRRDHGGFALIWPLHGPITSPFGYRFHPILKLWKLHTGMDIGVPSGTPIHAAEDGQVIYAGWMTGYGYIVLIDHGMVNGHDIVTGYAHQSRLGVSAGDTVVQGQVIGYVGMTGWATGPHLHFEVRVDGTPVDPANWLP